MILRLRTVHRFHSTRRLLSMSRSLPDTIRTCNRRRLQEHLQTYLQHRSGFHPSTHQHTGCPPVSDSIGWITFLSHAADFPYRPRMSFTRRA